MNKRAVNYHTRDLNQYPFFNYNKRRQSHGVSLSPRETTTTIHEMGTSQAVPRG